MRRCLLALAAIAALVGCGSSHAVPRSPAATAAASPAKAAPARRAPVRHGARHPAVPILMYHVIHPPPPGTPYPALWVPPADFRAQMDALAAAGYTAVTLDQVLANWDHRIALPARPIVVSFDDGYGSQARDALPILRSHRWPGVLNLKVDNTRVAGGLPPSGVRAMVMAGWEIDAHTITHPDLTTVDAARLHEEVAGSRALIRREFGVAVDNFCYPSGRFDPTVEAAVRAAGYRAATTTQPGLAHSTGDRFALNRIRVDGGESSAGVLAAIRSAT